jgi:hypothetical protein
MLWLLRPVVRIERIDVEAESLIRELGEDAHAEALRKESESSSASIARDWGRVAQAISKRTGLNAVPLMSLDADVAHSDPIPASGLGGKSELSPLDQLNRSQSGRPQQFRVQFLGATHGRVGSVLKEVGIEGADVSGAIVAAASLALPHTTKGLHILDREGRQVFARQKADPGLRAHTWRDGQELLGLAERVRLLPALRAGHLSFSGLRLWTRMSARKVIEAALPFVSYVCNATVQPGEPGSSAKRGWSSFSDGLSESYFSLVEQAKRIVDTKERWRRAPRAQNG